MQTFSQERKPAQKQAPSILVRSNPATLRPVHREHPILQLPRHAEVPGVGSTAAASHHFDLSSISIYPFVPGVIQTRLAVNQPGDKYEQEAERIADQVLTPSDGPAVSGACLHIQRFSEQSDKQTEWAPASIDQTLTSSSMPLEPTLRQDMEQRFGYNCSGVRVYTDTAAEQSAREVNARAYTVGHNIVFGAGQFAPGTNKGRHLLAHELTHVVQQQSLAGSLLPMHHPFAGKVNTTPPGLQREVVISPAGTATDVKFTVGKEITPALAAAAKAAVAKGLLDDTQLEKLRTAALVSGETVDDNERMFMAALLDPANASRLKARRFNVNDMIQFSVESISAARRARIIDLDRPAYPAKIAAEAKAAVTSASNLNPISAVTHATAAIKETFAEVDRLIVDPKFNALAHAAMTRAAKKNLAAPVVLRAMIAAASDSTPGDMALAGAVYVIAVEIGSPLAGDILDGNIKVDEMPHSAMKGNWASYMSAGNTDKGDTMSMPSDFDINNLMHRAAVVHELKHAEQDKASTGSTVKSIARDRDEMRAYRTHNRYELDSIAALNGAEHAKAIAQVAAEWNEIDAGAMALEARPDPMRLVPTFILINAAAKPGARLADNIIHALLTADEARIENALLAAIRLHYGLTSEAKNKMIEDGLRGESILDWINRPMPTGP